MTAAWWLIAVFVWWFVVAVLATRKRRELPPATLADELELMPFPIRQLTQVEEIIDGNGPAMRPYDYWRAIWEDTGDVDALHQMERFVEWHPS